MLEVDNDLVGPDRPAKFISRDESAATLSK
jgi:hypothetical protein